VKTTDKVHKVAEWLVTRDFASLPVTHKTDVIGMISRKDIIRILREDEELRNTPVESIMNFAPTTIGSGLGMKKALTLIDLAGETSAAVIDEDKKFLGTISTRDLVTYLEAPRKRPSKGDFQGEKVHRDRTIDSLTEMPQVLLRTDPLSKLMDLMVDQKIDTVYVLDGYELAGSVNEVDLLELFMRGPSRGGPLIQVAGIDDVKLMDASELESIIKKFASRIEKFTMVSAITIRIRHHHHETDEDKYTVNVKLTTPTEVISREAYDWDLLVAIGNAFVHIEQQLKKEKSKAQKVTRKHS
jgi:CBS domain-containing protein